MVPLLSPAPVRLLYGVALVGFKLVGFALVMLATLVGCEANIERSELATGLPALASDPAETEATEGDWPMWRGVNSQGIASEGPLPTRWTATEGMAWSIPVPGEGNSSPVVWGDRIFLTTAIREAGTHRGKLLCFDRADGHLRWEAEAGVIAGDTHPKNGRASASVATDGQRVVASFGSSGLFCFDVEGKPIWHVPLGPIHHDWGSASSPVLWRHLVIQLCDYDGDSYLAAFEKSTGNEVWRTPRTSRGCWTTPVFVDVQAKDAQGDEPASRTEMIVNGTGTDEGSNGHVIAYDPTTGKELWRVGGTTDIVTPTTLVGADLVYSSSGRNGPTIAIQPGGRGDVTESNVVWKVGRGAPYIPTGVAYRNRLYFVTDSGVAVCYNAGNGERIWKHRLGDEFTASLVAGDGKIHAVSERGRVYVLAAADEFKLLATNEMNERALATPAISRGELFLRTESHLYRTQSVEPAELADFEPFEHNAVAR